MQALAQKETTCRTSPAAKLAFHLPLADWRGHRYDRGMSRPVFVHLLPSLFQPDDLRGSLAVVIDVLRASTTIVHALAAGAQGVIPVETVDEAREIAGSFPNNHVVLGGERDSRRIDGFDLGNSPRRYTAETVGGRSVVFTTTNGTRALHRSRQADRVLIGAFVNLNAVLGLLADDDRPVHLVCAGTRGEVTAEDVLCAGALVIGLNNVIGGTCSLSDAARIAADDFTVRSPNRHCFTRALQTSLGGRNLEQAGFGDDIAIAATWDRFDLVPEFSAETGRITIAKKPPNAPSRCLAAPPE